MIPKIISNFFNNLSVRVLSMLCWYYVKIKHKIWYFLFFSLCPAAPTGKEVVSEPATYIHLDRKPEIQVKNVFSSQFFLLRAESLLSSQRLALQQPCLFLTNVLEHSLHVDVEEEQNIPALFRFLAIAPFAKQSRGRRQSFNKNKKTNLFHVLDC